VSIFAVALQSTTTSKYNVACDPYNLGLIDPEVAIGNFDLHITERKADIGLGGIETSGKPDGLLISGLAGSGFINHQ